MYFVSSPMPTATPSSGHEPRPSARRSASQSTTIVVSWSNATGWNSQLVAIAPGENPTRIAASVCARRLATELACYEGADDHRPRAGEDGERAETDQ